MLLLFVSHLGPAEVAAWSILGVIWKVLETSTEGIGEAAAIRVAYHLGHNNPAMAERASFKAIFIAAIQSLFVTAILFMFGKNIIRWLTTDATLQNMLNDTISLLGLGNVVMTYSMVMWSSVGSQGRYRLATLVILVSRWLVTIPYAAVMVYAFKLDLSSLMGSVIVGFATAGLSLAYVLLRSDWERLATILQELNAMMEFESDSDESSDEESEDNDEADDGVVSSPASIMRRNT
jgi:MATE family multidrug resistance protein